MNKYLSASGLMLACDMPLSRSFFADGKRYVLREKSVLNICNNDDIFFLYDGLVSINCIKEPKKTVFYLGNNCLVNEPYINDGCLQLRVAAIADSVLLRKSTIEFFQALEDVDFYREITAFLGVKLVNLMRQMRFLSFQDAGERIENFEVDMREMLGASGKRSYDIHIAQEEIAKTVGVHRVTVSKTRKNSPLRFLD